MKIVKNIEVDNSKWKELLDTSPYASAFQTEQFYDFYNSIHNYSADVFAIEVADKYKSLVVVTLQKEKGIKRYFSRRAIVHGGVIFDDNLSDSIPVEQLLLCISKVLKGKAIYCEIRNSFDYSKFRYLFEKHGWIYEPRLNVQLSLQGKSADEVFAGMKYNRRREIKMSFKEGAEVREAFNTDEVFSLYDILKELYKVRVRLPMPTFDYFKRLFESNIGKVFVVIHEGKIIGGTFCVYAPGNSINTLYYAGLRNYNKRIFPTHLAVWGAIKFGLDNNLKMIDFMGAGKPGIPYGVRDYKLEFGGDLVEHGRFIKVLNPVLFKIGKLGLKILSKIKQ